jgi:exonuclease SbcC
MLKSVTLTNFQKHVDLTISFDSGVNYVYGASESGKSCIRRAIQWLLFNDGKVKSLRRHGTKQTSVLGVFDNGFIVERVVSSGVNRYIVKHPNGKEDVYDNFGANVPDEVKKALRVSTINIEDKEEDLNLNIAKQVTLPFLMDRKASFRLKLFNKLSGNDVVDKVIQGLNKDVLSIGREFKAKEEFIASNSGTLETYSKELEVKKLKLETVSLLYTKVVNAVKQYNMIKEVYTKLLTVNNDLLNCLTSLKSIVILPTDRLEAIKAKITKYDTVKALSKRINDLNEELSRNQKLLTTIQIRPESIFDDVKNKITKYNALQTINAQYTKLLKEITETKEKIVSLETASKEYDKQYKDKLVEAKICPVCRQGTEKCKDV